MREHLDPEASPLVLEPNVLKGRLTRRRRRGDGNCADGHRPRLLGVRDFAVGAVGPGALSKQAYRAACGRAERLRSCFAGGGPTRELGDIAGLQNKRSAAARPWGEGRKIPLVIPVVAGLISLRAHRGGTSLRSGLLVLTSTPSAHTSGIVAAPVYVCSGPLPTSRAAGNAENDSRKTGPQG